MPLFHICEHTLSSGLSDSQQTYSSYLQYWAMGQLQILCSDLWI
jgi:hypothetical protein